MEWIKIIVPSVIPLIGVLIGIAALWWKITTSVATKAEMNRADDKLQEQINLLAVSIQTVMKELREDMRQLRSDILKLGEKMDTGFIRLNEKMDAGFTRFDEKIDVNSQAHSSDINKLNEKMDTGFTRLDEKIDANSRAHHRDIMQVIDKIDGVANDLRAEIRERTSDKTDDVDS